MLRGVGAVIVSAGIGLASLGCGGPCGLEICGSGQDAAPGLIDAHVACSGRCAAPVPSCLLPEEMCVGCQFNSDCSTSRCDVRRHVCVECVNEFDCRPAHPVCDRVTGACVGCTDDAQCPQHSGIPFCDTIGGACVECVTDTTCTNPTVGHCGPDHTCQRCTADAQCVHLGDRYRACGEGECGRCSATDESACGATSCDPHYRECTLTPHASIATLGRCVSDSECMSATDRCVTVYLTGTALGGYCLTPASAGCTPPYAVRSPARASASGAAPDVYCSVTETRTTIEAVGDLVAGRACTTDSECGLPMLSDGLCRTVAGVADRCTYACASNAECPSGMSCGAAGCGAVP